MLSGFAVDLVEGDTFGKREAAHNLSDERLGARVDRVVLEVCGEETEERVQRVLGADQDAAAPDEYLELFRLKDERRRPPDAGQLGARPRLDPVGDERDAAAAASVTQRISGWESLTMSRKGFAISNEQRSTR